MKLFDHIDNFMHWAWGPYQYPRWQRRLYILLWPVLMPVRWLGLGAIVIAGVIIWAFFALIFGAVNFCVDTVTDLGRHIHKQWN